MSHPTPDRDRVSVMGDVERHDAKVGAASVWFYVDHAQRLVDIASIRVPRAKRGKGAASQALAYALGFADLHHYRATLGASPLDERTNLERLVALYERHGFARTGERINPLGHPKMERGARDAPYARAGVRAGGRVSGIKPPRAVVDEARRALAWRRRFGRGGTEVGLHTAAMLARGVPISLRKIAPMARYFPRHAVDARAEGWRPGEAGYPSAGRIAWALWGGTPGRRWAARVLRQIERTKSRGGR